MKKLLLFIAFVSLVSIANAQCTAGFTYTVSGDTVIFTDASTHSSPVIYTWDFGNGNQATWANPSIPLHQYFPYAGKFNVCLHIQDTMPVTCSNTYCDSVLVTGSPHYPCNATFTIWGDTSSLIGFISNMSTYYGHRWIWNFGDGTYDSTGHNSAINHHYAIPGYYYACLTATTNMGDICSYCDSVNAIPCASTLNVSFTRIINIDTVNFISTCSGSTLSNPWQWNFGDGNYSNVQNPLHVYQYNGTYTVCLTYVKDSSGCSKTFCNTITITGASPFPCNAIFSYNTDTTMSNYVHFYDQSSMSIVDWSWSFPGGTRSTSTSSSVYVNYPSPGTYMAYLTVTNLSGIQCSYSDTVYSGTSCIGTNAYFTMSSTSTPHVWSVVNMSTGAPPISYSWNWGDSTAFSTGATPTHTYAHAGWYNICLTIVDANGCGSSYCNHDSLYKLNSTNSMITIIVTSPTTGINNYSLDDVFSVYPNPANDNITVLFSNAGDESYLIELFDIMGNKVFSKQISTTTNISLENVSKGVYICRILNANNIKLYNSKLIIIK